MENYPNRPIHFVIRSSELEKTLEFLKTVLGMKVLRHEENHEPCEISCNGPYNNAWSKTMIGYEKEDVSYCFEVTYNYPTLEGVVTYTPDDSIQFFAIGVNDKEAILNGASNLGYEVKDGIIVGPDGYKYKPLSKPTGRQEPFLGIRLRVSSIDVTKEFYTGVIGMKVIDEYPSLGEVNQDVKVICLSFDVNHCLYQFIEDTSKGPITVESGWQGRNALGVADVEGVYQRLKDKKGVIHHEKRTIDDNPNLEIFIAKDFDGYEICIITLSEFVKGAVKGTDYKEPDWENRKLFILTHSI
jgi:catechol 2,3-dioxygenase-like lactoylglutathione lyase family enzyme